jgi:UDP-N-acetylmuramoyl-tripeptide--D-alanyl-D-alanine ligase
VHRRTVSSRARIVAVTGSLGKTTTMNAVSAVLGGPEHHLNQNTEKGTCRKILKARPWHRHIVLEVAITKSRDMKTRVELVAPDVAIVTSIASDHSDCYPTLEDTREEKAELVRALSGDGLAVLNGDDPNVLWMAGQTRARALTYGFGAENDIRAEEPMIRWPDGMEFVAHTPSGSLRVETRLVGRVMVYPLLAALAVGEHEGLATAEVVEKLAGLEPEGMRLDPVALPNGIFLLRDYCKASVESVRAALETLAQIPGRRLIVLGDMEHINDPEAIGPLYREVAQRAEQVASVVCFLADNYDAYRAGLSSPADHRRCESVFEVAEWLKGELREGDVVLLKSMKHQKFDRIPIALRGEPVQCGVMTCLASFHCASCPFLARRPEEVSQAEIAAMAPWGIHRVPHLAGRG